MKKVLSFSLFLVLYLCFSVQKIQANHIYGADVFYKYIGPKPGDPTKDIYEINLIYYRNCAGGGAQLSATYEFGAYDGLTNQEVLRFNIPQVSLNTLVYYAPRCIYPNGICIEEGLYQTQIELPNNRPGNPGFHISHYTYRRNVTSANVNVGNNVWGPDGIALYAFIPPSQYQNTSPVFLAKPVPYMCVSSPGQPRIFSFNHNGFDADGDSLVFSFAHPYGGIGTNGNQTGGQGGAVAGRAGGVPNNPLPLGAIPRPNPPLPGTIYNPNAQSYPLVNFAAGYNFPNNIMPTVAGTGGMQINPSTGEITLQPSQVGSFVLAVEVKEFRVNRATGQATYLGAIRRDLLFFVGNTCTTNDPPNINISAINPPQASVDSFIIDEGQTLTFTVTATDPDPGDSVFLFRNGTFFDGSAGVPPPYAVLNEDSGRNTVVSNFSWTPDCTFARVAPYFFNIIVFDNNCNRTEKTIFIKVNPKEIIQPPDLRCIKTINNSVIQLDWVRTVTPVDDFKHYKIYRRVRGSGGPWVAVDSIPNINTTTWQDLNATNAKTTSYEYQITGVNLCDEEGLPSGTLRSIVVDGTKITGTILDLFWNSISDSTGLGDTYRVYSEDRATNTRMLLGTTMNLAYRVQECDLEDTRFVIEITDPLTMCISYSCSDYFRLKDSIPPTPPAVIGGTVNTTNQIQMDFFASDSLDVGEYVFFRSINGGLVQRYDSIPSTGAATYAWLDNNVDAKANEYCYEIHAKDTCDNLSLASIRHCLVRLIGTPGQQSAILNWNSYQGFTIREQVVQRLDGGVWTDIATLPANATTYTDMGLTACLLYTYRLQVFDASANAYVSLSSEADVMPLDSVPPPPPTIRSASVVSGTEVEIFFDPSVRTSVSAYEAFVSINAGLFNSAGVYPSTGGAIGQINVTGLNTVDNILCFYVEAYDSCSMLNSNPSNQHCVINLQGNPGSLRAILNWSFYMGYATGIANYQVEKLVGGTWTAISGLLPNTANSYIDSIGLACGVPYEYRIVGFEQNGNNYTTLSNEVTVIPFENNPPLDVDTRYITVRQNNNTIVDLAFVPVPDPTVATYDIEYSTNGGPFVWVNNIPAIPGPVITSSISGLDCSRNRYCIRVYALDTCGSRSEVSTVETHCSILQTSTGGNLAANLNWTAYQGFPVSNYEIEKWDGTAWQVIGSTSNLTYTDAPIACNTPELYRIKAYEMGGTGEISYSDIDTVIAFDTIPPLPPSIMSVSVRNGSSIDINFMRSTSSDAIGYQIYASTNGGGFVPIRRINSLNPVINYTHTGINPTNNRYCFRIETIDSCSNSNLSQPSPMHCAMELSGTPGNLASILTWRPYVGFNFNQYIIQRWTGSNYINIGTVPSTDTTFIDNVGLECNQRYIYRIMVNEVGGNLQTSLSDETRVTPFDTINPQAPELMSVSVASPNSIDINFKQSTSGDVSSYEIFASTNGGPYSRITTIPAFLTPTRTLTHSGIDPTNNRYCYFVQAIDSCSSLNRSNRSNLHCAIELTATAGNLSVDLNWRHYIGFNFTQYQIQRRIGGVWTTIGNVPASDSTYRDAANLACNVNYQYRVFAVENGGNNQTTFSDEADATPFNTTMPAPPEINYVTLTTPTTIQIGWTPSPNPRVERYRVWRGPVGGPMTAIGIGSGPPFTYDNTFGAASNQIWCYQLEALDSCSLTPSVRSPEHCTIKLNIQQNQCNLQVDLDWNIYKYWTTGILRHEIHRSVNNAPFTLYTTLGPNDSTYSDLNVTFNDKYCYKVIAIEGTGTYQSASTELNCVTLRNIVTPELLLVSKTATSPVNGAVDVTWRSLASVPSAGHYNVYHSPTAGGPFTQVGTNIPVGQTTWTHTGINTSTANHWYRVSLTDICGNESGQSNDHNTMDLTMSSGQLSHLLNWTPYGGEPVTGYEVYRWNGGLWQFMGSTAPNVLNYTVFPAPCNTPIAYRISAITNNGISFSDTASTFSIDSVPALPPTILNASVTDDNHIDVTYEESASSDVYAYIVYRQTNTGGYLPLNWVFATGPGNISVYRDTVNTLTGYHCYRFETIDSCVNITESTPFCAIQLEGMAGSLQNDLIWRPIRGYNVGQYSIQTFDGATWTTIASVPGTDTTFTHTNLTCFEPYNYRIMGENTSGTVFSLSDTIILTPFDTTSPNMPTILRATVINNNSIDVDFVASSSPDVNRHEVFYSQNGGGYISAGIVNSTGISPLTFSHTGINPAVNRYCYQVVAIDSCSDNRSDSSSMHCPVLLSGNAGNLTSDLNWSDYVGFGVGWYYIQIWDGTMWVNIDSVPAGTTTYRDSLGLFNGLACGVSYTYRILTSQMGGANQISTSDTIVITPFDTVRPIRPELMNATVSGATSIELTFRASVSDDVDRYEVLCAVNGGAYNSVGLFNSPLTPIIQYNHTGIDPINNSYCYQIVAVDSCNDNKSAPSDEHCVIPLTGNPGNLSSQLNWNDYVGYGTDWYYIQIWNGSMWITIDSVMPGTGNYLDSLGYQGYLECGIPYSYRIVTNESSGGNNQTTVSDSIVVIPFDNESPNPPTLVNATVSGATSIELTIDKSISGDVDRYEVFYSENNGLYVSAGVFNAPLTNRFNFSHTGIDPINNFYCYEVVAVDSCSSNRSVRSNRHCVIALSGTAGNLSSQLSWNDYIGYTTDWYYIQIWNGTGWQTIDSVRWGVRGYLDQMGYQGYLACGVPYAYRVTSKERGGNLQVTVSDSIIVIPLDTVRPTPPTLINASVSGASSVDLSIQQSASGDVDRFEIFFSTNGGAFVSGGVFNALVGTNFSFTHTGIDPINNDYCYEIVAVDSCSDNRSDPSNRHCVIALNGSPGNLSAQLNWSDYVGYPTDWHYIQIWNGTNWQTIDSVATGTENYLDQLGYQGYLACGVPYSYRITSRERGGNNQFTISDSIVVIPQDTVRPTPPTLINASVSGANSVDLSIQQSASGDVDRFEIFFSTNGGAFVSGGVFNALVGTNFSFTHTGIDPINNDYCYEIVAVDSCSDNRSNPSNRHCVIPLSGSSGNLSSQLTWDDYIGYGTDWYYIQIWNGTGWQTIDSVRVGTESYLDQNGFAGFLACNVPYSYRVFSRESAGGNNQITFSDSIVVVPFDTLRPNPPTIINATVSGATSVELTIQQSNSGDAERFEIFYSTNAGVFVSAGVLNANPNATSNFTHSGIDPINNEYCYEIVAIDSCMDNRSNPSNRHCVIPLSGSSGNLSSQLTWNDYVGYGTDWYYIQIWDGTMWVTIDSVPAGTGSYLDQNGFGGFLECNRAYSYRVITNESAGGNNQTTISDSIVVIPFDSLSPMAPELMNASVSGVNSIDLTFRVSASGDVDRYEIFYSQNAGAFVSAGIVNYAGNPTISFTHNGVTPITDEYCYQIVAIDSCADNRSNPSNTHCVVALTGAPGNLSAQLSWTDYIGYANIQRYVIQRWNGTNWVNIDSVAFGTNNYLDQGLACNFAYHYRILTREMNGNLQVSISDSVMVIPFDTIPPAPAILNSVSVLSNNQIQIDWAASPDGDAVTYEVWRRDPGGAFMMVASFMNQFTYTDVVPNSTQQNRYEYYIITIDSCDVANRSIPTNPHITMDLKTPGKNTCDPEVPMEWDAYPYFPDGLNRYVIWRNRNGGAFARLDSVTAMDTSYLDQAVDTSSVYCYFIQAISNSGSNESLSDEFCIKPSIFPDILPTFINGGTVTATGIANGANELSWRFRDPAIDTLATGYVVYHSTVSRNGPYNMVYTTLNLLDTVFTHQPTNTQSANNFYMVTVSNSCGGESDTSFSHKLMDLTVVNNNLSASISWTPYVGFTIDNYVLQKSKNGGSWVNLASFASHDTIYVDTVLSCGENYAYRIQASELGGNNYISHSDTDQIVAYDYIPPDAAPVDFATVTSTDQTTGSIQLRFNAPIQQNKSGYNLYRSINGGAYVPILFSNPANGIISYNDMNLNTKDDLHRYYITSLDSCGNESDSTEIHRPVNLSVVAASEVNNLSWTNYEGFANYDYLIERKLASTAWTTLATVPSIQITYSDSMIRCDSVYYYRIRSNDLDNVGFNSFSDTVGVLAVDFSAPIPPDFNFVTIDATSDFAGQITVNWNLASGSRDIAEYILSRKTLAAVTWDTIANLGLVNSYVDMNLNTRDEIYLYRIEAVDSCGNSSLMPNNEHGTIHLNTTPGNEAAHLDWTAYIGANVNSYEIWRDGMLVGTVPGNQLFYTDTFLLCINIYRYEVRANLATGPTYQSVSNYSDVRPFDTNSPYTPYLKVSSIEPNDSVVTVRWRKSLSFDANYYEVFRSIQGFSGGQIVYTSTNSDDTSFVDNQFIDSENNSYCYKLITHDFCGNSSDTSNLGCTMKLQGESLDLASQLNWTRYKTWNGGVLKYEIWRSDDGAVPIFVGETDSATLTYIDDNLAEDVRNFCYHIKAIEGAGSCDEMSKSNTICLIQKPKVFFPTGFNPGSTIGVNTTFGPIGTYFESMEMSIYNRWGELIFYSNSKDKFWNGKHNNEGELVQQGAYVYRVRIIDYEGKPHKFTGMITIAY